MKLIGLTGGIGSGKSTIADLFLKKGIRVIDADIVYKELSKPGQVLYNDIVAGFGESILNPNGTINFHILADLVFHDESLRLKLNAITHPLVREEMLKEAKSLKNQALAVFVVPLLFESKTDDVCDLTICVYVDLRTQISRVMSRDRIDHETALLKIGAQLPLKKKAQMSDYVIDNSLSMSETIRQFESLFADIRRI